MRQILLSILLLPSLALATSAPFEEFKQGWQQEQQDYIQQRQQDYEAFRTQYLADYDAFRGQLMQNWAEPVQSSLEQQIVYSDNLQSRIIIDEDAQTLVIEQLSDDLGVGQQESVRDLLTDINTAPVLKVLSDNNEALQRQLQQTQAKITHQPKAVVSQPVLEQQIETQHEQVLSSLDANEKLPQQVVEQKKQRLEQEKQQRLVMLEQQVQQVAKQDVTYKNIKSYTIALPQDYLYRKAAPYLEFYSQYAVQQRQELALLLAISHAESSFNPEAKSHIPAFGLMQIVPSSAGMDVANKILHQTAAPTANELFQPGTNILYGAGYLSILSERYLKGVRDPVSRKYCTIAAYNTGAGNVAKAFNGGHNRNTRQAITKINGMSSDQVYQSLMQKLPYSETKKYLKKVRKLDEQYQANLPTWNLNDKANKI